MMGIAREPMNRVRNSEIRSKVMRTESTGSVTIESEVDPSSLLLNLV